MSELKPTEVDVVQAHPQKEPLRMMVNNDITTFGDYAWIATNNSEIRRVDLKLPPDQKGKPWEGHTAPVNSLDVYTNGNNSRIISGSEDNDIRVWDMSAVSVSTSSGHGDLQRLVTIPSLKLLATSGVAPVVQLWNLSNTNEELKCRATSADSGWPTTVGRVSCVAYVPDPKGTDAMNLLTAHCLAPPRLGPTPSSTTGKFIWWTYDRGSSATEELNSEAKLTLVPRPFCEGHYKDAINDMICISGQLWTASADKTVKVLWNPCIDADPQFSTLLHDAAVQTLIHTSQFKPWADDHPSEEYVISGAGKYLYIWNVSALKPTTPGGEPAPRIRPWKHPYPSDVTIVRFWKMDEALGVPIVVISQENSWVLQRLTELNPRLQVDTAGIDVTPADSQIRDSLSRFTVSLPSVLPSNLDLPTLRMF